MDRPKSVRAFFFIYLVSVAITAVSMTRSIVLAPENFSKSFMVGAALVLLALFAGLGYKIYTGKNWARLLLTLGFLAGSALVLIKSQPQVVPPPIPAVQWTQALLQLACIVLLYVKSSREWFLMMRAGGH